MFPVIPAAPEPAKQPYNPGTHAFLSLLIEKTYRIPVPNRARFSPRFLSWIIVFSCRKAMSRKFLKKISTRPIRRQAEMMAISAAIAGFSNIRLSFSSQTPCQWCVQLKRSGQPDSPGTAWLFRSDRPCRDRSHTVYEIQQG